MRCRDAPARGLDFSAPGGLGETFPFRPIDQGFLEAVWHGGSEVGSTADLPSNDGVDDQFWHNGVPERFPGLCNDVWFEQALGFIEKNREEHFLCWIAPSVNSSETRAETVKRIDANLARLREKIASLPEERANNTVLMFFAASGPDNPAAAGGVSPLPGGQGSLLDGGHRVPCFMHWPAKELTGGRDIDFPCSAIDFKPTFNHMLAIHAAREMPMNGHDVRGAIRDQPGRTARWMRRKFIVISPGQKSAAIAERVQRRERALALRSKPRCRRGGLQSRIATRARRCRCRERGKRR